MRPTAWCRQGFWNWNGFCCGRGHRWFRRSTGVFHAPRFPGVPSGPASPSPSPSPSCIAPFCRGVKVCRVSRTNETVGTICHTAVESVVAHAEDFPSQLLLLQLLLATSHVGRRRELPGCRNLLRLGKHAKRVNASSNLFLSSLHFSISSGVLRRMIWAARPVSCCIWMWFWMILGWAVKVQPSMPQVTCSETWALRRSWDLKDRLHRSHEKGRFCSDAKFLTKPPWPYDFDWFEVAEKWP